jgi:hypothetical protein
MGGDIRTKSERRQRKHASRWTRRLRRALWLLPHTRWLRVVAFTISVPIPIVLRFMRKRSRRLAASSNPKS